MGNRVKPRIRWGTIAEYQNLWQRAEVRNPYLSPGWLRALARTYGFPLKFALWEGAGVPFLVVPGLWRGQARRLVSLPFSDRSGVVRRDPGPEHLTAEEMAALQEFLGKSPWELRNLTAPENPKVPPSYENFVVPLEPAQDPTKGIKSAARRNARKAQRQGVEPHRTTRLEDLWVFYRLFGATHRRHGVPVQPWSWFRTLWQEVLQTGQGFLTVARYRGRIIAGALFLVDGATVVYKYGATDYRFQQLRPSDLIFYHEILQAWQEGYRAFDLGRVGPGERGLRDYKRKWGAQPVPLFYYSSTEGWQPPAETSKLYQRASHLLQRAPVALLRGLGTTLYAYWA